MILSKVKGLLIAFALLTFVSQSVASAVSSCQITQNSPDSTMAMMEMDGMDHSNHIMDSSMDNNLSSTEASYCCMQDCNCSVSGCFSAGMITTSPQGIALVVSDHINQYELLAASRHSLSIFRPPISS